MKKIFVVSGIDTDIGKSVVVGCIARGLLDEGYRVITMKPVQTGCKDVSEDIVLHRRYMGQGLFEEDKNGLTCPYLYKKPCSPHLAAHIEQRPIDKEVINDAAAVLQKRYQRVLIEGAGGLFVPLNEDLLFIDYLNEHHWPVILVTGPRLGSLNHTLASLEALSSREIPVAGIIYNTYQATDATICQDSLEMMQRYSQKYRFFCPIVELKKIDSTTTSDYQKLARLCR